LIHQTFEFFDGGTGQFDGHVLSPAGARPQLGYGGQSLLGGSIGRGNFISFELRGAAAILNRVLPVHSPPLAAEKTPAFCRLAACGAILHFRFARENRS